MDGSRVNHIDESRFDTTAQYCLSSFEGARAERFRYGKDQLSNLFLNLRRQNSEMLTLAK